MLITDDYRQQNKHLHEACAEYGIGGHQWADAVRQLAAACKAGSILDYGCGKSSLKQSLMDLPINEYDPAFHEVPPLPADLVTCTDVLEHIEPDCLDDVLNDLRRCTLKAVFLIVATARAMKTLRDGRNAHLIVEDQHWWLPRLMERWDIKQFADLNHRFLVIGAPR